MTRCGHIAIIGAPNAGKSTLINRLTGSRIAIVSPKVQTTRVRLRGVCVEGEAQLVFIDTPGIFDAKRKFEQGMVKEAWAGASDADVVLLLIDASKGLDADTIAIAESLKKRKNLRACLALNKIDEVKKPFLLKLAEACTQLGAFEQVFMISAKEGDGVDDIRRYLAKASPEGPWHYPEDYLTDLPMRELAAEITREKLFLILRQELPYSLKVETEKWDEKGKGLTISQAITVEREGQKKIVIGEKGATLKKIGMSARKELERMLERKLRLELFVRVDENWKERGA